MGWPPCLGLFSRFRQRIGDEAVLGGGRQRADGRWIRRRGNGVKKAHVADVVQVDFLLEDYGKSLAIQSNGEDGGREGKFAYDRGSLGGHRESVGWRAAKDHALRTLVFWITRWRGERMRATSEVEKSISMMAMFPSSLLNMREKGSVW